jgi:hypothetical protein
MRPCVPGGSQGTCTLGVGIIFKRRNGHTAFP